MRTRVLRDWTNASTILDSIKTSKDLEEFSHFRRELPLAHRPLQPATVYPDEPRPVTAEALRQWADSSEYLAAHAMYASYPDRSLCRPIDRMLLYHLVRSLRPEHVIEIGTYFAAGSEVLARALWENGGGLLHTIDPFGVIRCPALIGRWDERLQQHIRFYPWTSMELFHRMAEQNFSIDLAFIDGNHDFEFALFDLQSAARFIRPGGIVVLDDANQSGPFWAAKVFLEQNPGWVEVGDCLKQAESDPFGPLPSLFPESKFLLLQSPREVTVGRLPFTTGAVPFEGGQLDGIQFDIAPGQYGEILGRVFLRGFPSGDIPQQLASSFRIDVNGENQRTLIFEEVLRTRYAADSVLPPHSVEIVLLWRPGRRGDVLRLVQNPLPLQATGTNSSWPISVSSTSGTPNQCDGIARAA